MNITRESPYRFNLFFYLHQKCLCTVINKTLEMNYTVNKDHLRDFCKLTNFIMFEIWKKITLLLGVIYLTG